MTYKQIPFTLEEWQKDPEGRKIKIGQRISVYAHYFPNIPFGLAIITDHATAEVYSIDHAEEKFTLLIPVKTVRKWRGLYRDYSGNWRNSKEKAEHELFQRPYAIESAEFDEEGNYVKGTVKVEEV